MSKWNILVAMVINILVVNADNESNMKAFLLKLDEQVKIIAEQAEVIEEVKNSSIAALKKDLEEYKNTTTELENKLEEQAEVIDEYKNTTADLENEVETMKEQIANLTTAPGRGRKHNKELFPIEKANSRKLVEKTAQLSQSLSNLSDPDLVWFWFWSRLWVHRKTPSVERINTFNTKQNFCICQPKFGDPLVVGNFWGLKFLSRWIHPCGPLHNSLTTTMTPESTDSGQWLDDENQIWE